MRIWLHSTAKTATIGQSTLVSLVAHAVLVGAAVYSTGVNALQIQEKIAQRIFYLPPPDRHPVSENLVEHLQYLDVGTAAPVVPTREDGRLKAGKEEVVLPKPGGDKGADVFSQAPAIAYESQDSVYSILDVEESAARTAGSAAPVYPTELMKAGKEGGVYIRFVVDTSGHADSASIEVLRASHPLFVESVKRAVPQMLFTPAMVGGRKVRQAVEQNFEFRIAVSAPAEHTKASRAP
ncbi:MAG: energy transducer TonB [Gemmatimonadaceae bacterium]